MKNKINKSWIAIFVLCVFVLVSGCGNNEKAKKESPGPASGANQIQPAVPASPSSNAEPNVTAGQTDIAVSVNGKVLKKAELESKIKEKIKIFKDKIPVDRQKEFEENLRKQLVNAFIMRTILAEEIAKRKIEVTEQEIKATKDKIQATLPPNKKLDDVLKENGISQEDIAFSVKVEKFQNMEIGEKAKPTQQEISKFYKENREKLFMEPESVHVRHILVSVGKDDNDKIKAQKKEKIENLRQQLLKGADFAELARKNSDCPSKEAGGDLSFIKKGQMVKKFEDAAFSQQKNAIGPVVTTEYGYHIIQVLDRKPAKKVALEEAKGKISAYLDQRKKAEAFNAVLKKLKDNAKIVVY